MEDNRQIIMKGDLSTYVINNNLQIINSFYNYKDIHKYMYMDLIFHFYKSNIIYIYII